MAMVLLHRGLQFRGEMADEKENRNWMVKDFGNITAQTECTFSYGFRPKSECDLSGVKEIPFQVHLLYTRPNGMQCLRVASTVVPVTEDRQQAEENADAEVIGTHAANRAAKYAKEGDYESAQLETRSAQRFMLRNNVENISDWNEQVESMDKVLREEKQKEKDIGAKQDTKLRKKMRNDEVSTAISKTSNANSKWLWKK